MSLVSRPCDVLDSAILKLLTSWFRDRKMLLLVPMKSVRRNSHYSENCDCWRYNASDSPVRDHKAVNDFSVSLQLARTYVATTSSISHRLASTYSGYWLEGLMKLRSSFACSRPLFHV
jgi:hypothetical protein